MHRDRDNILRVLWLTAGAGLIALSALFLSTRDDRPDGDPEAARFAPTGRNSSALGDDSGRGPGRSRPALSPRAGNPRRKLDARRDSHAEARDLGAESAAAEDRDDPRSRNRILHGRLVDATNGRAVARSEVRFSIQSSQGTTARSAITDARGEFTLAGLATSRLRLRTLVPGYQTDLRSIAAHSGDADAQPSPLEIPLEPGLTLSGRVIDADARALADVDVRWVRRDGTSSGSARRRTDADGFFSISGLAPGRGLVRYRRDGFRAPPAARVELDADVTLEVVLEPDRPLRVLVVDSEDRPVPDAELRWTAMDGIPSGTRERSDENGELTLSQLPTGEDAKVRLRTRHPNFVLNDVQVAVRELYERVPYRLVLDAGEDVSGSVRTTSGQPASRVRLLLNGEGYRRSLASAHDGSFRFRRVPRKRTLTLSADGGERGHAFVEIAATDRREDLRLILERDDGTIAGRVTGPEGEDDAVANAVVVAYRKGRQFTTFAGADGNFRFESLPDGDYGIRVSARPHGAAVLRSVSTGQTDLQVRLGAYGNLRGFARLSGPPRPYTVRLRPVESEARGAVARTGDLLYRFTAKDLQFRCPKVPAGSYEVRLERGGAALSSSLTVRVLAGETATLPDFSVIEER